MLNMLIKRLTFFVLSPVWLLPLLGLETSLGVECFSEVKYSVYSIIILFFMYECFNFRYVSVINQLESNHHHLQQCYVFCLSVCTQDSTVTCKFWWHFSGLYMTRKNVIWCQFASFCWYFIHYLIERELQIGCARWRQVEVWECRWLLVVVYAWLFSRQAVRCKVCCCIQERSLRVQWLRCFICWPLVRIKSAACARLFIAKICRTWWICLLLSSSLPSSFTSRLYKFPPSTHVTRWCGCQLGFCSGLDCSVVGTNGWFCILSTSSLCSGSSKKIPVYAFLFFLQWHFSVINMSICCCVPMCMWCFQHICGMCRLFSPN